MSDIHEFNSGNLESHRRQTVVLRNVSHGQLQLMKTNKMLLYIIAGLMLVVVIMGVMLFPTNNLMDNYQQHRVTMNANNMQMNPALSAEIKMLKSQLIGLISGSIESRLRVIEESIQPGAMNMAAKGALKDIKNDVKVLKTYSATGAGRLIVEKYAQQETVSSIDKQLMQEISQLKNLIYLSIASCGLMLAAIGGVWFKTQYRIGFDAHHSDAPLQRDHSD